MSFQLSTAKRSLVATRVFTNPSLNPRTTTVTISYTRPQRRKWSGKKQAYVAAIVAVTVWITYNALVMTDVPDTKPTVHLSFQGQP